MRRSMYLCNLTPSCQVKINYVNFIIGQIKNICSEISITSCSNDQIRSSNNIVDSMTDRDHETAVGLVSRENFASGRMETRCELALLWTIKQDWSKIPISSSACRGRMRCSEGHTANKQFVLVSHTMMYIESMYHADTSGCCRTEALSKTQINSLQRNVVNCSAITGY
jgi:hypothetical protein